MKFTEILNEVNSDFSTLLKYPVQNTSSWLGNAAIDYRSNQQMFNAYVLNSKGDGWFRKTEGISKGYGLALKNIKVTQKEGKIFGDYLQYKVKLTYIDDNTEKETTDMGYLVINTKNTTLDEVLNYISKKFT